MQNPEENNEAPEQEQEEAAETVDRRLFDAEGNVREDVAEAREEEPEQPLSLELLRRQVQTLEAQTMRAMEQVDATFQQVGGELNQLTQQVRTAISDMHVRLGVLEELFMNADLHADRDSIMQSTFTLERFKAIAEEIVLPAMKVKAEAMQAKMKERFEKMQAFVQQGMSPEEASAKLQEEEAAEQDDKPDIEIVSG